MGVEILCRVDQSTKSLPGGISIYARLQGIQYGLALGGDVIVPGSKGVIIEVEFRVPKLVAQGILPQVGGDDNVQSSEAKKRFQGLMADLLVIGLLAAGNQNSEYNSYGSSAYVRLKYSF